jgi:DMSO reductase anchor subunit
MRVRERFSRRYLSPPPLDQINIFIQKLFVGRSFFSLSLFGFACKLVRNLKTKEIVLIVISLLLLFPNEIARGNQYRPLFFGHLLVEEERIYI